MGRNNCVTTDIRRSLGKPPIGGREPGVLGSAFGTGLEGLLQFRDEAADALAIHRSFLRDDHLAEYGRPHHPWVHQKFCSPTAINMACILTVCVTIVVSSLVPALGTYQQYSLPTNFSEF